MTQFPEFHVFRYSEPLAAAVASAGTYVTGPHIYNQMDDEPMYEGIPGQTDKIKMGNTADLSGLAGLTPEEREAVGTFFIDPHPITTTNHQPPTTNHQPPTTNHQPPTANHQPPTANRQPPTTNHQPPTTHHRRGTTPTPVAPAFAVLPGA